MAAIDDLLSQIENKKLRERIASEVNKLSNQKKFGLVFEDHLPEYTIIHGAPIRIGNYVKENKTKHEKLYKVLNIEGDTITCSPGEEEVVIFDRSDLVSITRFGDPIYPYLKEFDSIEKASDSDLWHVLIESDNYHALQLLEYLYAGQLDCIYIDPPYNTGDTQWKYNNNYVDTKDSYRHSKWLSFMKRRLKIAKELLNPKDSVLIITIDEKEYIHLGALLEEMFPEANIQMVSTVINPKGSDRDGFSRSDEYIYFVMFGKSKPTKLELSNEWSSSAKKSGMQVNKSEIKKVEPKWTSMMRRGTASLREDVPTLYYPIYVDPETLTIKDIGEVIPKGEDRGPEKDGLVQTLPLRRNEQQGRWMVKPSELRSRIKQGRVRLGRKTSYGYVINYLPDGQYQDVLEGHYKIEGRSEDNSLIAYKTTESSESLRKPPTQWKISTHDASEYGTNLLRKFLPDRSFTFPKSLYAVHDTIKYFVSDKPNAKVLDFFAGSGTTMHAVNLLNGQDGGNRQCILVTNNELSNKESKLLTEQGYKPGNREWEAKGIAEYVTWPRIKTSITGKNTLGESVVGKYIGTNKAFYDGFSSNVIYFKLGFLDKQSVALGRQFANLLPVLWMKAGAFGECPTISAVTNDEYLIFERNKMAVLLDERYFSEFVTEIKDRGEVQTIFIVTDSLNGYREMLQSFPNKNTYHLYRDYLDNFRINVRRG